MSSDLPTIRPEWLEGITRFCDLPDGQQFKLTACGPTLTKQGDGFTTSWGATVPCRAPFVGVIANIRACNEARS